MDRLAAMHYQGGEKEATMTPRCHRDTAVKPIGLAFALIAMSAIGVAGCMSQQQTVANNEDNLAAAGFFVQPANTPERQAMLNRLPPHHFVQRIRGNTVSYVYADPLVCNCLYVGSQQAYNQYRLHIEQQKLADEQELTAQMYSDSAWNWGAWGPWGPDYVIERGPRLGW